MDEKIFIITEGLKGLNNAAVELIKKGEYDEAEKMFLTAESTYKLFKCDEGISMIRVSLANLSLMRGNIADALGHVETATCVCPPGKRRDEACDLHKKVAFMALKMGMEKEKSGDLRDALELFERIVPHLNEKRAALVSKEIESLKVHLEKG